jgi:hypothetical protein
MAGVLVVGEALPASAVPVALASDSSGASPQLITVPATNVDPVQLVVILVVGLGTGLALAALLMVMRLRLADRPVGRGSEDGGPRPSSLPSSDTGTP